MSRQTLSGQPLLTERPTTEAGDSRPDRRDVDGRRDPSRSRWTAWPRLAALLARPRGHVIGRAVGEPSAQPSVERPRGHVVADNALPSPAPTTYR